MVKPKSRAPKGLRPHSSTTESRGASRKPFSGLLPTRSGRMLKRSQFYSKGLPLIQELRRLLLKNLGKILPNNSRSSVVANEWMKRNMTNLILRC